jgi:hypothetical protein
MDLVENPQRFEIFFIPLPICIKAIVVKVMCKYCDGVYEWNLNPHNPVFLSIT